MAIHVEHVGVLERAREVSRLGKVRISGEILLG